MLPHRIQKIEDRKRNIRIWIYIAVLVLFGIFLIYHMVTVNNLKKKIDYKNEIISENKDIIQQKSDLIVTTSIEFVDFIKYYLKKDLTIQKGYLDEYTIE